MRLRSSALISVLAIVVLLLASAVPARAQPAPPAQPPVELSRFDIGAYVSFKQTGAPAVGDRTWTGPGLSLDVNANLSERFALSTRVETFFDGTLSALAGAQFSTDFLYPNKRDPIPGRFFAKALAGVVRERSGVTRPALHVGAGADGILSGRRGVGLHWDAGWEIVPGSAYRRFRGRVAIGVIIGPRTSPSASTQSRRRS